MKIKLSTVFSASILMIGCVGCGDSSQQEQPMITPETTLISNDLQLTENASAQLTETEANIAETTAVTGEGGGNPSITNTFAITISEQKYFYENQEISFEKLSDKLAEAKDKGEIEVVLTDNHGTVKAFDDLTKFLDDKQITYTINDPS